MAAEGHADARRRWALGVALAAAAALVGGRVYVGRRAPGRPAPAADRAEPTLAAKAPADSAPPRIPRRVFQTARSAADVDADLARRLETTSPGFERVFFDDAAAQEYMARAYAGCLLYTSPSPRDRQKSRMPSSA